MINSSFIIKIEGELALRKFLELTKLVIKIRISIYLFHAIRFDLFKTFVHQAIEKLLLLCHNLRVNSLTTVSHRCISLPETAPVPSHKRLSIVERWQTGLD